MVHTGETTQSVVDTLFNSSSFSNTSVQWPEEEDDRSVLAVMGMLAFFSVIGTAGNSMVLYVYVRKRHKLAATVFIISLAATDFMTSLVIVPYTIAVEYLDYYIQYDFACKLYMFFITSNVPFAAFIMVAIAFDRYLCICHPFMHLMNAKRAKLTLLALALMSFTLGIITSLNYGVYDLAEVDPCSNPLSDDGRINSSVFKLTTGNIHGIVYNTSYSAESPGRGVPVRFDNRHRSCVMYNITYTGRCVPNEIVFSRHFITNYQKVYATFFLLALLAVIILYGMVYRSVLVRRAKRRRQRRSTRTVSLTKDSWFSEYRQSQANIPKHTTENGEERHPDVELARQLTIRERGLVANIRTAAMLFVVTAMFIIAFLPAWLMAHDVIDYNMIVFYMYFIYNVANPIIYAFMNKAFRRDLRDVFDCKAILRDFR
ncbi:orexin receptor type 2-like [Mizuhopecten yessoensis]|uniref:Orexin receptor type 2 n=1 Tax=Mizuhopecten yessoensis TaxID=6573 RepID=A0A210Q5S0_MIZYE|nr:orexin receptor type 2-like [Mizuhopecten yessoensis]XP_021366552.1 orexin receptor type 2-like [Mizuhopecten yessoensis]OWF44029.1 Orexin receptor type 2 [Mizuhopecten yessoensis]